VDDQVVYLATGNVWTGYRHSTFRLVACAVHRDTICLRERDQSGFGGYGGGYTFGVMQSAVITGNAEKPYAPVHLDAVISGSDIVLHWDRRDRLGFSLTVAPTFH
jgi:hypothetical protein